MRRLEKVGPRKHCNVISHRKVPVQVGHHVLHCDVVTQRQSSDELSEFEHSIRHNPITLGSMVLFTKPLNLLTHIDEVVVDVKGE